MPSRSYVICTLPRSGSTLLSEGLIVTGVAGHPAEWFAPAASSEHPWLHNISDLEGIVAAHAARYAALTDQEYVQQVLRDGTTTNGVFGVKLHLGQIDEAKRRLRRCATHVTGGLVSLLHEHLGDPYFVWLTRADKVAQGISLYRAIESGQFVGAHEPTPPAHVPREPDLSEIHRHVELLTAQDAVWQTIFDRAQLNPMIVSYEALSQHYQQTIGSVLDYLGIEHPAWQNLESPLRKQADSVSADWRRRFTARYGSAVETDPPEVLIPWADALLA